MEAVQEKHSKYPKYKDSGEYWMGEIPASWDVKRLKHIFNEKKIAHNPELNCGSISFGKVVYKDDDKIPLSTKASYQEVLEGEFLINPLNLNYDLISLRIALSDKNVVVSSGYIVLKDKGQIDKVYYKWLLHRYDVAYMKLLGSGVRQTINFNHIANSLLAFPPLPEQTAIANFLDNKTAKIDTAIAQKEKTIALLKERKQIMIQNAVTKGLDPNAKMKDSGVEWIGEIPEGWEVKRLKFLGNIRYGLGQPPKEKEGGLPIIRATNVERGKIVEKGLIFVDPDDIPWDRNPELKKDEIIVVRSGAYTGDSAIVTQKYHNSIAGYDMVFTPTNSKPQFISYALLSNYVLYSQLYLLRMRAAQPHLNAEELGETLIITPTEKEQTLIVSYIENQSTKIDKSIALQQKQIDRLKEYKAVLIDSAVTGKIKVSYE
jgi:type I restriction enzyme S subunit